MADFSPVNLRALCGYVPEIQVHPWPKPL